ncbi:hypothetical protein [Caulobacter sp. 17J80-11]|uniref:hypothetical protein n=1 Tax=Caulobacter sp. 17J80-11 TaxID=2763502 RepID=UPI001653955D|nr:hypothetical protein [Caulobacter sp. 17J80-11]MBC6982666.1 hypothetical protein [Caulobacter sp. 17J80-11]
MRRTAVALAALAAVWGTTPAFAQTDTSDRDLSCMAVMAFAVAALDNPQEDSLLRIYFAYYLGRLNARDSNAQWADRGIERLKAMTGDQLKTTLLVCADTADREFNTALPTSGGAGASSDGDGGASATGSA